MTLLSLENLRASYGVTPALHGVSLTVDEGEAVALMGRNGMGKSTTVRCIARMMPSTGRISFAGQEIARLSSHQVARLGVGLVPEGRRCFAPLTVWENLVAASRPGAWGWSEISELFPKLAERREQRASTLSGGEQQMLTIARALMTNPRLLILDEATEGLAPVVRQDIWRAIQSLRASGLSILIIDKSLAELRSVAERAVILERGRDVWTGSMASLTVELADRHLGV